MPERYFRTVGTTPLDDLHTEDQAVVARLTMQAVMTAHVLEHGGRLEVNVGDKDRIGELIWGYELGLRGLGNNTFEVRAWKKEEAPQEQGDNAPI